MKYAESTIRTKFVDVMTFGIRYVTVNNSNNNIKQTKFQVA